MPLTEERLRELLHYNQETGLFTWRLWRGNTALAGGIAGYVAKGGYVQISVDGLDYRAHRLAWLYMTGRWPFPQCDHEDRDRSNNKWGNLREATRTENPRNQMRKRGFKGCTWYKRNQKWAAYINIDCKRIFLGLFSLKADALICYNYHAAYLYGEFACLNPILRGYAHD
jgi:hypothetical protein